MMSMMNLVLSLNVKFGGNHKIGEFWKPHKFGECVKTGESGVWCLWVGFFTNGGQLSHCLITHSPALPP